MSVTQTNDVRTGLRRRPAETAVVGARDGGPEQVVEPAYLCDQERPNGEHRSVPISVND